MYVDNFQVVFCFQMVLIKVRIERNFCTLIFGLFVSILEKQSFLILFNNVLDAGKEASESCLNFHYCL